MQTYGVKTTSSHEVPTHQLKGKSPIPGQAHLTHACRNILCITLHLRKKVMKLSRKLRYNVCHPNPMYYILWVVKDV